MNSIEIQEQKKTVNEKIIETFQNRPYLEKIKELLRDKYGLDVFQYRMPYFLRRISMLSKKLATTDLQKIHAHIGASHSGYLDFLNTLTIHVTEFFRDKSMWEYLQNHLFHRIITQQDNIRFRRNNPLMIWSAGCSSGQEPYSLAISFVEAYKKAQLSFGRPLSMRSPVPFGLPIKIIASDINQNIINTAKEGRYTEKYLRNAEPQVIKTYFKEVINKKGVTEYQLIPEIKNLVEFKKIDLFKDPFPKGLDMITCRNVVIYFTKDQQRELFHKYWESLKSQGIMIIGKSELLPPESKLLFDLEMMVEHVYRKRDEPEKPPRLSL